MKASQQGYTYHLLLTQIQFGSPISNFSSIGSEVWQLLMKNITCILGAANKIIGNFDQQENIRVIFKKPYHMPGKVFYKPENTL